MKKFHYLSSWRPPRLAGLSDLQLRLHVRDSSMGMFPVLFFLLCEPLIVLLTLGEVKTLYNQDVGGAHEMGNLCGFS